MPSDRLLKYSHSPLLLPALAVAFGIGASLLFPSVITFTIPAIVAAGIFIAICFTGRTQGLLFASAIGLVFAAIGAFDVYMRRPADLKTLDDAYMLGGYIQKSTPTTTGTTYKIEVDRAIDSLGYESRIPPTRMILHSDSQPVDAGNRIAFKATITPIGQNTVSFDTYRFLNAMRSKNIRYSASVASWQSAHSLTDLGPAKGLSPAMTRAREKFSYTLLSSRLLPDTKSFVNAILCGDSSLITERQRTLFAESGLAHLLALSGLHIGILAAILICILLPLNLILNYKLRYVGVIILCWVFTAFTGCSPSIVRACTMLSLYFLALVIERPNSRINALAAAFLILLLVNPFNLIDAGFQLSFISVGAIILFTDRLNPFRQRQHPLVYKTASLAIASLVAITATSIITAYHFGNVQLLALPHNLIAIPLMTPYLGIALIYAASLHLGLDPELLRIWLDNGYMILTRLVETLHTNPISINPSTASLILWIIGLCGLGAAIVSRRKGLIKFLPPAVALCASVILIVLVPQSQSEGIIISTTAGQLHVSYRIDSEEGSDIFARGASEIIIRADKHIGVLQTTIDNLTIQQQEDYSKADVLILGGSFSGPLPYYGCSTFRDSLSITANNPPAYPYKPQLIILGPYLKATVRDDIISQGHTLGIPVHSLRDSGPCKLFK